jgi:transcriptional activator of cad operon
MKEIEIGKWVLHTGASRLVRAGRNVQLDIHSLRVLECLAGRPGEVVSTEELLKVGWPGTNVSMQSVYQTMTTLRRKLGDDSGNPSYIETVPRLGYKMVAPVTVLPETVVEVITQSKTGRRIAYWVRVALVVALVIGLGYMLRHRVRSAAHALVTPLGEGPLVKADVPEVKVAPGAPGQPDKDPLAVRAAALIGRSIAVLPFQDLTEGMKEETFADGMTEEIIDRLSKIPGFKVPAAAVSFYFKGKDMKPSEIANSLGVEYVVDGSVRRSGNRVRVATRLMRADDGYVIWTETYDRPFGDILKVQDEIAAAVATELQPAP